MLESVREIVKPVGTPLQEIINVQKYMCVGRHTGGNCRGIWKVSATVAVTVALDMALTDQ